MKNYQLMNRMVEWRMAVRDFLTQKDLANHLFSVTRIEFLYGFDFSTIISSKIIFELLDNIVNLTKQYKGLFIIVGGQAIQNTNYRGDIDVWLFTQSGNSVTSKIELSTSTNQNFHLTKYVENDNGLSKLKLYWQNSIKHKSKLVDIREEKLLDHTAERLIRRITDNNRNKGHAIIPSSLRGTPWRTQSVYFSN